jgi:hypothetical protein
MSSCRSVLQVTFMRIHPLTEHRKVLKVQDVLPAEEVARINKIVWDISVTITPTTPFDDQRIKDAQWSLVLQRAEAQRLDST